VNPVVDRWVGAGRAPGHHLGSLLRLGDDLDPVAEPTLTLSGNGIPVDAMLLTGTGTRMPVRASVVVIGGRDGPRQGIVVALSALDHRGADGGRPFSEVEPAVAGSESGTDEAPAKTPARVGLQTRLTQMIADTAGTGRHVAVLVLDIAQLRHVNAAFGRKAGDELLRAVADRLRKEIREREVVERVGSDEFVLLLDELGRSADAVALATRLIRVFDPPFSVEGVEVRVRASVGVSLYPEHGDDAESLLQRAETAVSWARDHGQDQVQLYGSHMSGPALDRLVLERALQAALEDEQLELVYQPQVDVPGGTISGVEALVRWQHPQHGQIPAVTLIALAEETGLIVGLGEWVLRTACRQLAHWRDGGLRPLRLAVNVSPRQFLQPGLVESIRRSLRDFGLEPASLSIEITENVLLRDVERARETLEQVKAMGVEIALDDFGVGYSSLGYLSRFPVDCVKIDRSFVDNVTVDGHDRTICLAVLAMAKSMRRRVIAEGVETLEQARFFASKGCDALQGYYLSGPVGAADIEQLLRDDVRFRTT
jgi:diguanylate cyclase (GGDEF)-like protein